MGEARRQFRSASRTVWILGLDVRSVRRQVCDDIHKQLGSMRRECRSQGWIRGVGGYGHTYLLQKAAAVKVRGMQLLHTHPRVGILPRNSPLQWGCTPEVREHGWMQVERERRRGKVGQEMRGNAVPKRSRHEQRRM